MFIDSDFSGLGNLSSDFDLGSGSISRSDSPVRVSSDAVSSDAAPSNYQYSPDLASGDMIDSFSMAMSPLGGFDQGMFGDFDFDFDIGGLDNLTNGILGAASKEFQKNLEFDLAIARLSNSFGRAKSAISLFSY